MKILLIAAASLVLMALGVAGFGYLLPRRHVASRSASYHATPEQLFGLIAGLQNWRPDVLRCVSIPDATGREFMGETTHHGDTIAYELLDKGTEITVSFPR